MKKQYFLTPGPSELYFTVPDHLRMALRENVASISHRSKAFEAIYAHAVEQLSMLLNIPDSHQVLFTASATEVWERLLQNCVEKGTFHLVNGAFSERFYQFGEMLGYQATRFAKPEGEGFVAAEVEVPAEAEMICVTQNETSTGVSMAEAEIARLHDKYPDKLLVVDAVSSIPFPDLDYSKVDALFFSVQKGMGLPAGLGVWIVGPRCVEKARALQASGQVIGTYHSLPSLLEKAAKNQNPETPNVLGIYLLGKVAEDMNRKGITAIRHETRYKAALLYGLFERHPRLQPFVRQGGLRSPTVLVAEVKEGGAASLVASLKEQGIVIGTGYGKLKQSQVRVANFPAHSKEIFERLADLLEGY